MPQATDEYRDEWGIGEDRAIEYLQRRGWRLTNTFEWERPHAGYKPDNKERSAVNFLIDEWDYGGWCD